MYQLPIFILFLSAGVLFECSFSCFQAFFFSQVVDPVYFKFCCAYRIIKKRRYPQELKDSWITTDILRSARNKEKQHDVFKWERTIIKELLRTPKLITLTLLHPGPKWYPKNMGKNKEITNVNKTFTIFP